SRTAAGRRRRRARSRRLVASRAEQLVGGGERRVETFGLLAAGLREVGPAPTAPADQRRELLDDVPGVVAPGEVLGDRRQQPGALAGRSAEHDHPRLDALA